MDGAGPSRGDTSRRHAPSSTREIASRAELERRVAHDVRRAVRTRTTGCLLLVGLERQTPAPRRLRAGEGLSHGLAQCGRVMRDVVRDIDLVAEYREDCVAVVLSGAELPTAQRVAERLLRLGELALRQARAAGDAPAAPRLNVGIAVFPGAAASAKALLRTAESALEEARETDQPIVAYGTESEPLGEPLTDAVGVIADELVALLSGAIDAQERERAHVARELHDGPAQSLASALTLADLVRSELKCDPQLAERLLNELREQIEQTLDEVRRISRNLRPVMLDFVGLVPAVRHLVEESGGEGEAVPFVALRVSGEPRRLDPELELGVFRIVQEALNNCRRHAEAAHVLIELEFGAHTFVVRISDDGKGIAYADLAHLAANGHYGLVHMRERSWQLGGTFSLRSAPGWGTTITVRIPAEATAEAWKE